MPQAVREIRISPLAPDFSLFQVRARPNPYQYPFEGMPSRYVNDGFIALNLKRPFKGHSVWDEDLIEERSKTLLNVDVKIWPRR